MFMLHDSASNQARHNCALFAAGYSIILSLIYGIIASHMLCFYCVQNGGEIIG